jgi:hypothetical protein
MKAPSVPHVVSDWAGFYLGVHGGYGWARFSSDNFDPVPVALAPGAPRNPQPQGTLFGGHAGFNGNGARGWAAWRSTSPVPI